jgi:hypothetical protein
MSDYPEELIESLADAGARTAIMRQGWNKTIEAILDELSRTHTILPNSGYTDLLARSEKLRGIEWQMNNPCQNCGGDCLECQHYEDKRRYGW